ncbi:MAG: hypothetical protein OEX04_20410, partial [Acidimicrobiia bacterium]|nr:hypothetical protein [Acidimicrobiia bacterium]
MSAPPTESRAEEGRSPAGICNQQGGARPVLVFELEGVDLDVTEVELVSVTGPTDHVAEHMSEIRDVGGERAASPGRRTLA